MDQNLSDNALKGKIARLPAKVRDQVCQRLHDGQPGSVILPWLNALPEVKELVFHGFKGIPVGDENLSVWRKTGYQDWLRRHERIERTKELSRYAAEVSRANGASIADGAAAIASGKLLELLEAVDEAAADQEDEKKPKKLPGEILIAVANALGGLRTSEQNDVRLRQNDKRLKQTDERIALETAKYQRDTAGMALKVLNDERAKAIECGSGTNEQKLEAMGQHLFGELWKPQAAAPAGK